VIATFDILLIASTVTFCLLGVALAGIIWRILRGPSVVDRVLGLDLLSIYLLCFAAVHALASGDSAFLDVAIALALVAFVGTVALARHVERRRDRGVAQPAGADSADGPARVRS